MRKLVLSCLSMFLLYASNAQNERVEVEPVGFKKENVFIGGSLTLGFGASNSYYSGGTNFVIGANPEIGYSLAKWVDVGFVFNAIYNNQRFGDAYYRYRQTAMNWGTGVFLRLYPISSFFVLAQPEHNWIKYTQTNLDQPGVPKVSQKVKASSFLVGVGYGQRNIGHSGFYTVIMLDLLQEYYSPYRDRYNSAIPVIRTGFNWYLNPSKKKR